MALDSHDLELIRGLFDERATRTDDAVNRMEGRLFGEVEKIAGKVDILASNAQTMAERVSRVEQEAQTFRESRFSQGERIGNVERDFSSLAAEVKTHLATSAAVRDVKGNNREWIKWLVATVIAIGGIIGVDFLKG